jgi:hypothetical protein
MDAFRFPKRLTNDSEMKMSKSVYISKIDRFIDEHKGSKDAEISKGTRSVI